MSPNDNPNLAISANKKLKTPLKASVILLTSVILSACGSSGSESYNLDDVFGSSPTVGGGASQEELDKANQEKQEALEKAEAEKKAKEAAEQAAAEQKAKAEAAEKAAAEQKANAEAAQKEAANAKAELAKVQAELAQAKQDLENALASGNGNTDYLEAQVERRENELKAAQAAVEAAEQQAVNAQQSAEAQAQTAQEALQVANDAAAAAEIQNTPESAKSGVQILNVDVIPLSQVFNTTTRDFDVDSTSVVARADLASESEPGAGDGLLGQVPVTISGDNDADVAGTNGFKAHEDSTIVEALGNELPLTYTSTYKDFDDDMRIGHIDGKAVFNGIELPVNGVAVVGNATQAANMPTEGTVGYTGDATHRKLGIGNDIEFGSSVFTADFVAKSLEGNLSFANAGDIALTAGINGNQFSGSADANNGYATEGGFYGGDAQYLGGVYEGNGAQGTYGAKSDAQTAAEQAATDAQAQAEAAQKALAAEQAKADEAKAAAEQAKADAAVAEEELQKAKDALENAGEGSNEQALQEALEKAQAEADQAKADAAEAIKAAQENAQQEVAAAQEQAQIAEQQAKSALDEAKVAKAAAAAAAAAAVAAEKDAADKIAAAESAAKEDIAEAEKLAETAKKEAEQAEADRIAAEKEAAEADKLATEAEEKAAKAAQDKADADKRIKELEAELQALKNPNEPQPEPYSSEAEADKSGVQHISIDANGISPQVGVRTTTSREFTIRSTSDVDARADLALEGVVQEPVAIQVSGDADTDTNNGFKAYEGTASVLGTDNLSYTSTYKDFGSDEMRIAHIDGAATVDLGGGPTDVPVNGVAVVGNKTATLPTEGTANYAGDATNRKVGADGQIEYGSSEFTADFVNKSLDGTLKFKQAGEIGLSAAIEGNEFSGAADANNGYATEGAFYGADAKYVGGIYEGNGSQGTYGATKDGAPAELVEPTPVPVNPDVAPDAEMTGFQSTALSSKYTELPYNQGILENAIGYVTIRNDKSNWSGNQGDLVDKDGSLIPVDTKDGDNFTSFDSLSVRADMVKPESVQKPMDISLSNPEKIVVDAGKGAFLNPDLNYSAVYETFDQQMQVGHVYGHINSKFAGDLSRVANVFVQGHLTDQADIDYLKQVNDGKASYVGNATYIENIHLGDTGTFEPVNGSSSFDVDFVNNSVKGELAFDGDFQYNPTGKIGIEADITGNTFAGNVNGIDTAGGFYGEDAQYLGGIYQDASVEGGKGDVAGTGTRFQGTFGAEKQ